MSKRLFFNVTSSGYDLLTNQGVWFEQIADVTNHVPDPGQVRRVLDIGCGPGSSAFVMARTFPDAEVVGVDFAGEMIRRAKRHHAKQFADIENLSFEVGDATDLRFEDGAFDLITGHSFLYLVPDRSGVLRGLRRVLAAGGRLVLLEPNRRGTLKAAAAKNYERELAKFGSVDVARFKTSMVLWRLVSGNVGRLDPDEVVRWMFDAGFDDAAAVDTLGGLGMHCIGIAGNRSGGAAT